MARFESDPTSGGTVEEQTQEEDDTADDQTVNELKPDADGDPMREQTEPVDTTQAASSSPSPDTGGAARAPEAPEEAQTEAETEEQTQETPEPTSDASAPSPDTGGRARAPEAPPEAERTTSGDDTGETTRRPDVRREQSATPTSGGVAGPPGSDITVEPESRGQIEETKQRVAAQHDDLDAEDLRVTGDRDGRVSFELTEEAREERFNDLVEGREGAVRAVEQQYQRQLDFADFKQPGRSTPGGAAVPGPKIGMEGRASDPGTPRAVLRGGEVLAMERDLETNEFTIVVPDRVPIIGGSEVFTVKGAAGDYEPVREGETVRFEQRESFTIDSPSAADIGARIGLSPTTSRRVVGFIDNATPFVLRPGRYQDALEEAGAPIGSAVDVFAAGVGSFVASGGDPQAAGQAGARLSNRLQESESSSVGETVEAAETVLLEDTKGSTAGSIAAAGTRGVGRLLNVPATAAGGIEAGETLGAGAQATARGRGREFAGDVTERGAGTVAGFGEQAAAKPIETTAMLGGALVGSTAIFRAARARGPRTGAAARYAIQPGEELAGSAGFRATRAVAGERRAQQLFPNKEPLIFSEEAAIRGGRRVAERVRAADVRQRIRDFPEGGGASRGQARLTGPQRTRGRTEVEEDDDLGVPDDDPFRVSDKRLYDPAREFGDADDPSRFIDETRRDAPVSEQDIGEGIAGRGNPQTATGELSFEENFNRAIRRRQEAATRPEARVSDSELGTRRLETNIAGTEPAVSDLGLESEVMQAQEPQVHLRDRGRTRTDVETDVGFETAFETETETSREFETAQELRREFELETETTREFETELELEFESEAEVEVETEPLRENTRRRRGVSDLFAGERRTKTRRLIDPLTGR